MPILLWSSLARFVWRIRRKRIAEQGGIVAKVCHNTNQPNYSPHCPGTMWNWNVKKKYISYITILIDYHWDKTLQELSSLLLLWWSWRWRNKIPNHWLVLNIFNQFCVVLACYVPFWPACSSLFCALKSSVFYILCLLQKKNTFGKYTLFSGHTVSPHHTDQMAQTEDRCSAAAGVNIWKYHWLTQVGDEMCQIREVEMCSLAWGVERCQIWGVEMWSDTQPSICHSNVKGQTCQGCSFKNLYNNSS